jgi:hypothetical protein
LQGPERLYGLVFGASDLAAAATAPLFGLWMDNSGGGSGTPRYRAPLLSGAACSAAGNALYACAFASGRWETMLAGRLVAGLSAGAVGASAGYVGVTISLAHRHHILEQHHSAQSAARLAGPLLSLLFLLLPEPSAASSAALKLFNWYTSAGWLAAALILPAAAAFAWVFEDPSAANGHLVAHAAAAADARAPPPRGRLRRRVVRARLLPVGTLLRNVWADLRPASERSSSLAFYPSN